LNPPQFFNCRISPNKNDDSNSNQIFIHACPVWGWLDRLLHPSEATLTAQVQRTSLGRALNRQFTNINVYPSFWLAVLSHRVAVLRSSGNQWIIFVI
jgi:hypothetical protein